MTDPIRHNWPQIIRDLEAAGLTLHTISKMMRRQYVQVQRWLDGTEPKHYEGELLLLIHAEHVSRETLQNEVAQSQTSENSA